MPFELPKEYEAIFVGREDELRWLDGNIPRNTHSFSPIFISGQPGVGKTSLVKHWFISRRIAHKALWLNVSFSIVETALDNIIIQIIEQRDNPKYNTGAHVVIDETDHWTTKQYEEVTTRILNYKFILSVTFIRRDPINIIKSKYLFIKPLSDYLLGNLLKKLLPIDLTVTDEEIDTALVLASGSPLVLSLLARLVKDAQPILPLTNNPLYNLTDQILLPETEIVAVARPIIVSTNNDLIYSLKKHPHNLHNITPREFEILLADLLSDMGWEVKLTKQTRDGGADIFAYMNTTIGRFLCLVEAKHYREDRKIGVELVRTLYGTLCDAKANSAMLVTSSSFTPDARTFQKRHEHQLQLHDYANIVDWILKFGSSKDKAL